MIILAVSLPGLEFQAGMPIPGAAETVAPIPVPSVSPEPPTEPRYPPMPVRIMFFAGIVLVLIFLLRVLITLQMEHKARRITRIVIAVVLLILALYSAMEAPAKPPVPIPPVLPPELPLPVYVTSPLGTPPILLVLLVIGLLVVGTVLFIIWLLRRAIQPAPKANPLAAEAEAAMDAIARGQNVKNVIIRSYLNMESLMKEERGIERNAAVTPREFEGFLVEKGIPSRPILQLTRLFEKVRYGNLALNEQDERDAVTCLSAIQAASQPGGREML